MYVRFMLGELFRRSDARGSGKVWRGCTTTPVGQSDAILLRGGARKRSMADPAAENSCLRPITIVRPRGVSNVCIRARISSAFCVTHTRVMALEKRPGALDGGWPQPVGVLTDGGGAS